MRGRIGRRALWAILISAATLVPAAQAGANTLIVGSQFQGTIDPSVLDGGAGTVANTSLPAPLLAASPTDGTVISWRFSGEEVQWTPQVVHPLGGGLYNEGAAGPPQAGNGVPNISGPFPLTLPIKKGDHFGIAGGNFDVLGVLHSPSAVYVYFMPKLQPGAGQSPFSATGLEEGVSATVRYCLVPNLRGKKPKAARQELRAADCTVGTKKKSKKRKKKKKVLGQSVPAGTSISDTQPVNFKVSRKRR
jgi:PASTA domain-containing protein